MKYPEMDFYSGIMSSCYLNPRYHPGCLCCADHYDCYGDEAYKLFRVKACIMSELLEADDCMDLRAAGRIAKALGIEDHEEQVSSILKRKICRDVQIGNIVKLALDS